MENLFIWILFAAGAGLTLMGAVLVTSERELKAKRREVDLLLSKLEEVAAGHSSGPPSTPAQEDSAQLNELRAVNQDLQNQITGLTSKLEMSRRTIEEMENQHNHAEDAAEAQQLRATNEQLAHELDELRNRLRASERDQQSANATDREAGEQQLSRARSEIAELKRQLDESQEQIRQLRMSEQKTAELNALEAQHREEKQTFQARLADMENQLSAAREKLGELETLRAQIAESSSIERSLREQIRSHEEEVPRWQARIAALETSGAQLAALQKPYHDLLDKYASLTEMQRELQRDLSALADMIGAPATPAVASNGAEPSARRESMATVAAPAEVDKSRRFGIFAALLVLAAGGGAFALWSLASHSEPSDVQTALVKPQNKIASTPQSAREAPAPVIQEASIAAPAGEERQPAPKQSRETEIAPAPSEKPTARVAGTYEVTRPGRVYAAPSELSQRVGDIEPGTKVSVVDKRDGWLEIHSKHGRPPGFIRQNMAAPLTGKN